MQRGGKFARLDKEYSGGSQELQECGDGDEVKIMVDSDAE